MKSLYFLMWTVALLRALQTPEMFLPWQREARQKCAAEIKDNALVFLVAGLCAWDLQMLSSHYTFYLKAAGLAVFYGWGYFRGRSEIIFSLFYGTAFELIKIFPAPTSCAVMFVLILAGISLFQTALQGIRFRLLLMNPPKALAGLPVLMISLWTLIFIFYIPAQRLSALFFGS